MKINTTVFIDGITFWQEKERVKMTILRPRYNVLRPTYSTFLVQSGGLLRVINMQLVRIVHMMSMLNKVA